MKAYTDIEQSKKLAKILPLNSADMYYHNRSNIPDNYPLLIEWKHNNPLLSQEIPCWSLAALLGVLPFHLIVNNQRYAFSMHKGLNKDGETYVLRYNVFNTDICLYTTDYYNNPVDACVAMIELLHEQKLL